MAPSLTPSGRRKQLNIDERLEALTMNLELAASDIQKLQAVQAETTSQILALLTIAGLHQKRLDDLDGDKA
jgi:hypothetical protein